MVTNKTKIQVSVKGNDPLTVSLGDMIRVVLSTRAVDFEIMRPAAAMLEKIIKQAGSKKYDALVKTIKNDKGYLAYLGSIIATIQETAIALGFPEDKVYEKGTRDNFISNYVKDINGMVKEHRTYEHKKGKKEN